MLEYVLCSHWIGQSIPESGAGFYSLPRGFGLLGLLGASSDYFQTVVHDSVDRGCELGDQVLSGFRILDADCLRNLSVVRALYVAR